jgi:hypothetical protein
MQYQQKESKTDLKEKFDSKMSKKII